MKTRILNFVFPALALLAMTSCREKEWTYDNKVFISGDKVTSTILKPSVKSLEAELVAAVARPVDQTVNVTFVADASLIEAYNASCFDHAVMLPEANWTMSSNSTRIQQGTIESAPLALSFHDLDQLPTDQPYVLPVSIASAGMDILASASAVYYVFRGGSIINVVADFEKSNYIEFPSFRSGEGAGLDPFRALTDFTMEALVNIRQFQPGIQSVMGMEGKLLIRISDNGLEPNQLQVVTPFGNLPTSSADPSVCAMTPGEWTHIAVTGNSETRELIIYLNGEVAASTVMSGWNPIDLVTPYTSDKGSQYFHIGYSYEAGREMDGMISECRFWNIVRSADDIKANPYEVDPASEGLIGYWKFDEGQGSTITDYTGNGNNGSAHDENLTWVPVSIPEIGE